MIMQAMITGATATSTNKDEDEDAAARRTALIL